MNSHVPVKGGNDDVPLPHPFRKPKATTNAIRTKLFMSGEVKGQFTPRPVTEQRYTGVDARARIEFTKNYALQPSSVCNFRVELWFITNS